MVTDDVTDHNVMYYVHYDELYAFSCRFLADCTNGRAIGTARQSSVCLSYVT